MLWIRRKLMVTPGESSSTKDAHLRSLALPSRAVTLEGKRGGVQFAARGPKAPKRAFLQIGPLPFFSSVPPSRRDLLWKRPRPALVP